MKRLDLVVGPNGAGKSTFIALTLGPLLPGSVVVNADESPNSGGRRILRRTPTTLPRLPPPPDRH